MPRSTWRSARPERTRPRGRRLVSGGDKYAENERIKMSVNHDGTFEVSDKATGVTYHRVAAIEDVGDVGDEYNYSSAGRGSAASRAPTHVSSAVSRIGGGPLRAGLRVELELPLPRSASADRRARSPETVTMPVTIEATLDAGSPRVAFAVSVDNRAADHRLRLVFPTGAASVDTARADTAFDVITRPARIAVPATIRNEAPVSSLPMISIVDAGDDETGATVIGRGLMEYEITEGEPRIAMTLIRAVGDLSRNDLATRPSGHAGPPVATPGGAVPRAPPFRARLRTAWARAAGRRADGERSRAQYSAARRHRAMLERRRTADALVPAASSAGPATSC